MLSRERLFLTRFKPLFDQPAQSGGPCIVEPQDGTMIPGNWTRPRVYFTGGGDQHQIIIHADPMGRRMERGSADGRNYEHGRTRTPRPIPDRRSADNTLPETVVPGIDGTLTAAHHRNTS